MRGATFFSGLGGVDAGMKMAGIEPVAAVERDPDRMDYSEAMERSHSRNFPQSQFFLKTVQEMDWQDLARLRVEVLHASPMCSNFSPLSTLHGRKEADADRLSSLAIASGLEAIYPDYFSLEQAPDYLYSGSFRLIRSQLEKMEYKIKPMVVDVVYFGVPQNRKRLFILCSKAGKKEWRFPETSKRIVGWKEAIAGVSLSGCQDEFTDRQRALALPEDFMVQRISASRKLVIRKATEPSWTILRDHFNASGGGVRARVITAQIGTEIYNLPIRAIARLCSFPDWFDLEGRFTGMGLGYAVPPLMMKKLYQNLGV